MYCEILTVGKLKEAYLKAGIAEYQKRLQPVFPLRLAEVPDQPVPERAAAKEIAVVVEKEGAAILSRIQPDDIVVALAINGRQLSSEELAAQLNTWGMGGGRRLIFVIGGSCGLSPAVLNRANFQLSFGRATYPHQLMRLILVEQLYRAVKINRHEPYHK